MEHHPATNSYPEGYDVEFLTADGGTFTVVSVLTALLRAATGNDVVHIREKMMSSTNHVK